jgi:hypothetical protein
MEKKGVYPKAYLPPKYLDLNKIKLSGPKLN